MFSFYEKLWPIVVLANRSHIGMGSPINTLPEAKLVLSKQKVDPRLKLFFVTTPGCRMIAL